MNKVTNNLTVYFDSPFWVGVFERMEDGRLSVCKVTFGAEPKEVQIAEYLQQNYFSLKFSRTIQSEVVQRMHQNPKRIQRQVKKEMEARGIGTKSQQALKLQQEEVSKERKDRKKQNRRDHAQFLFEQKSEKRKQKHRGR